MGHGVVMRFLDVGKGCGFFAFTEIPDSHDTVSATSSDNIGQFMVEGKVGDGRWRFKRDLGGVGVVDIPDVGVGFHFIGGLLEPGNSI